MPAIPAHYAEGPEALIVSLAAKGDREAFAELVRRRQPWIRNLMRRCSGDVTLADDLSQQVFLQCWRKVRQLKEPQKFGGWLKRLAINEWLQYKRKTDGIQWSDDEDVELPHLDATPVAMDLDRAMGALPGPVSLCLALFYNERMSHGEIAALTDIKLGTVKSHIRRGGARLRALLSDYDETVPAENSSE